MTQIDEVGLPLAILDILPNPVLVKGSDLRYIWVNQAFEDLFAIKKEDVIGQLDIDIFPDRQSAQCNGGDLRVLNNGEIDEARETVFKDQNTPRITVTRKSRLSSNGKFFLVGLMHDITDVIETNEALEESRKQLQEQSVKLAEMAYSDSLTGVMNRRRLFDLADQAFLAFNNQGCILVCDLDHFKKINDRWGHDVGDAALIHFVGIVQTYLREEDLITRIGGEEFAFLLPGVNGKEGFATAERIRIKLEASPLTFKNKDISMTVSIGMAILEESDDFNLDGLLAKADKCLYEAKNTGRNKTVGHF